MAHNVGRARLAALVGVVAVALGTPAAWGVSEQRLDRQVSAGDFDPRTFPGRPVIDNPLLPWRPGTKFVYDGEVVEDGEHLAHRIVIVVTDVVKVVDGVRTRIIYDRDLSEGIREESELAFQAQDRQGNVWSLGEYPEEFEDGDFAGAPSTWLSGVRRARAGILMLARPTVGGPSYSQGFAPDIDFADRAKVIDKCRRVCVPLGCFDDVWVIDEWDARDPAGGHQLKYHAPGVGVVKIAARGGDAQERLSLVSVSRLSADDMSDVREQVLRMDRRAYRNARDVYAGTEPAYRLP